MKREELVKALRLALPGTERAAGGGMDRVLFDGDWLRSYNDNISVSTPLKTNMEIAVVAYEFYQILSKMSDEEIDIQVDADGKLTINSKKTKLKMAPLPVGDYKKLKDSILSLEVKEWQPLPKGFSKGIGLCMMSSLKDSRLGKISGMAFKGPDIVSTDNYKVGHFRMEGSISEELLRMKLSAVESLIRLHKEFELVAVNNAWLNLKAKDGMVISIRLLPSGEYPINDVLGVFKKYEGAGATVHEFPKGFDEAIGRVQVLEETEEAGEDYKTWINMRTEGGNMLLSSHRAIGEIEEQISWNVELPTPLRVNSAWMLRVLRETNKFKILTERKMLLFESPNFQYLFMTKFKKAQA